MDFDGTKAGFDLPMLHAVRGAVNVPVIASGGAGAVEHFAPAVVAGADAVLAASVFHFGELTIGAGQGGDGGRRDHGAMTLDAPSPRGLKRDANGLITAVTQERGTGKILMVAWMDDFALARTLETREATYYSRSRASTGSRVRRRATLNMCIRCGWIATAIRCCWKSTRSAARAIPESTAVLTPTSCCPRATRGLRPTVVPATPPAPCRRGCPC